MWQIQACCSLVMLVIWSWTPDWSRSLKEWWHPLATHCILTRLMYQYLLLRWEIALHLHSHTEFQGVINPWRQVLWCTMLIQFLRALVCSYLSDIMQWCQHTSRDAIVWPNTYHWVDMFFVCVCVCVLQVLCCDVTLELTNYCNPTKCQMSQHLCEFSVNSGQLKKNYATFLIF